MTIELLFGLVLGLLWGELVALAIRHTRWGVALAAHLMWLVVSIGCSGIFLISLLLLQPGGLILWWQLLALMVAGCAPIAAHSLLEGLIPYLVGMLESIKADGNPN